MNYELQAFYLDIFNAWFPISIERDLTMDPEPEDPQYPLTTYTPRRPKTRIPRITLIYNYGYYRRSRKKYYKAGDAWFLSFIRIG